MRMGGDGGIRSALGRAFGVGSTLDTFRKCVQACGNDPHNQHMKPNCSTGDAADDATYDMIADRNLALCKNACTAGAVAGQLIPKTSP
jgi:hypothetical protein